MTDPTPEQAKLREDLAAEYGDVVLRQAEELSGLALCMVAMAHDELTAEERETSFVRASRHLAALLGTMMQPAVAAKVNECAKRLDAAMDLWVADEIERRDGLAGVPPLWPHRMTR